MVVRELIWEIYKITRTFDGATYYGQHLNRKYPDDDGYMGSGQYLKRSINKYGKEAHTKEVIALAYSKAEADEYEIGIISKARSVGEKVMNLSNGGDGTYGFFDHYSPEEQAAFRLKCSLSLIGRPVSEETREKLRKARTGSKHKPEDIAKCGNGSRGRKHSQEELGKLSASHKGHITSSETRRKIGEANRGKVRSHEFRLFLSELQKGKKNPQHSIRMKLWNESLTDQQRLEIRKKKSESLKLTWAKRKVAMEGNP